MFYENIKVIKENKEDSNQEEEGQLDHREEDFQREYEEKAWKIDDHD